MAKPLFDVLADSPEFFVARGNTRFDILVFAVGLVVVPPTLLVLVEALFVRLPRVRAAVHLVLVALLFGAFAVQLLDEALTASSELLVALAGLLALAATVAYALTRAVPTVLTVLAPVPVLFLMLFLLGSDVSKLVLPQDGPQAAEARVASDTPIVMLVLDELDTNMLMDQRERIDRTRYPNLAALAGDGTWYRNATTVNSNTTLAVPALLSGRVPTPDMLPIAADYPNSLFTLFGGTHSPQVTETATELCPEKLCGERARDSTGERLRSLGKDMGIVALHLVAPEGLESRLPSVDQTFADFGEGGRDEAPVAKQPDVPLSALTNRPAQFEALVRHLRASPDRPTLGFLHAALPHIPWQYLPTGQQYINAGPDYPGLTEEVWAQEPFPPRLGLQRHLLQAGFADRLVGRLVARLRSVGLYDRALVVVTADHGVSFREGGPRRSPTRANVSDIAAVPLLIKYPNRRGGRVDDSFVRTVDIVPTIAAALGMDLPWETSGRPIVDGGPADGQVAVRAGSSAAVVKLPFAEFVRRRKAGLQRMLFLFGGHGGSERLYANGAHFDLLGRRPARLEEASAAAGRLELDSTDVLKPVEPDAKLVPSFVSGRIVGSLPPGEPVAVAINGVIRGVTETFEHAGETRVAALVNPRAFRTSQNSLDLFVVRGEGRDRRLAPLAVERPVPYRLVERDGELIIAGGGSEVAVEPDAGEGYIDTVEPDDQGIRLGGWAVAGEAPAPADLLLTFVDGKLVGRGTPTDPRPDIKARFGEQALKSGFALRVPVPVGRAQDLRVIAVAGDTATELPRWKP